MNDLGGIKIGDKNQHLEYSAIELSSENDDSKFKDEMILKK
ncbi:MAG: hypothetical protein ACOX39_00075 [Arcobacteraceae bacterium]